MAKNAKAEDAKAEEEARVVASYTLDEPRPRRGRGWKARLFFFGLKSGAAVGVCLGVARLVNTASEVASVHALQAWDRVLDKLTVTRVVTEFKEVDDATLGDIIARAAKEYGVDPLVMAVLAEKESRGGDQDSLYRFEPEKFEELRAKSQYKGISTNELRMIASSHGVFHIMGFSAKDYCGLHWSRLYDAWTAARCAATIVQKHSKGAVDIKDPSRRVREVFKRYNGSGERAERYADDAMGRLAGILYAKVAKP